VIECARIFKAIVLVRCIVVASAILVDKSVTCIPFRQKNAKTFALQKEMKRCKMLD
jgi:hypothetical protein